MGRSVNLTTHIQRQSLEYAVIYVFLQSLVLKHRNNATLRYPNENFLGSRFAAE
jgi:hypothetical protein